MGRGLLPVGLAATAWSLWMAEVVLLAGWEGLAWLERFQWAALPACVCAATAWLVALRPGRPPAAALTIAALGALGGFVLGRHALYHLGSIGFMLSYGPQGVWIVAGWALLALVVSTGGLTMAARRIDLHLPVRALGALVAAQLLALPMAWLTITIVPALNGSRDGIHAIKMGYPVFWVVVLCSAAGHLIRQRGWLSPPTTKEA